MMLFRRILLLVLAFAPVVPAADQLTGFPFQDETLRYRVSMAGANLGDVVLTAHRTGEGSWDFSMSATANLPIVPIADTYKSSSGGTDLCSSSLQREISHGNKKVIERTEFDQQYNRALRRTVVPAGGGRTEFDIPDCARDALTFQYYARRELGQGRVPSTSKVFFGSIYEVKMVYTGAQDVPVSGKPAVSDHLNVSVKGPASDFTFEVFYARDPARTPLAIKIPASAGTVTLELVR